MDIADHPPAIGAVKPLQAVADDGGAQMMHGHGLGDIGAAEIQDHASARARARKGATRIGGTKSADGSA